jgi:N-acetylmuramoyl-L-alanine amidase
MMCLFLWQASFFPALGQGSANEFENPINGTVKIVVQRGETLWGLAQSHHTTVDEIVKLNKVINPDHIREGESLWVSNRVVEEKPEKIEDIIVSDYSGVMITANEAVDNTVNPSWWLNALRRRIVQVGSISPRSSNTQPQESTILTYEIFVNQVTPDPPVINTLPDEIDVVQKRTVLKTTSLGAESQILSRSLGRLVSKEEVELLTRVIHGEARGENFEGQVAVGAVVLNRLKDPRFPKTIRAVVYQSGAFTAVDDKQIHLDPNDQSYKAAEAALSGLDPTNGALFYFNPRLATDRWIKSRPVIKRIGNHTFSI